MTKERLQDLAIGFDEYSFEPTILCDREAVIEEYRNAFTEMLKDYEMFEKVCYNVLEMFGLKLEFKEKEVLLEEVEQDKEQKPKHFKEWEGISKHISEIHSIREAELARLEKELEKTMTKKHIFEDGRYSNIDIVPPCEECEYCTDTLTDYTNGDYMWLCIQLPKDIEFDAINRIVEHYEIIHNKKSK